MSNIFTILHRSFSTYNFKISTIRFRKFIFYSAKCTYNWRELVQSRKLVDHKWSKGAGVGSKSEGVLVFWGIAKLEYISFKRKLYNYAQIVINHFIYTLKATTQRLNYVKKCFSMNVFQSSL